MITSSLKRKLFSLSFFFIISTCFLLYAEWIENINWGIGDLSFSSSGGASGHFREILNSPYIIYYKEYQNNNYIIIFDVNEKKIRGGRLLKFGTKADSLCVIPDPEYGWNLFYYYFSDKSIVGVLNILPDGQFGEDRLLEEAPTGSSLPFGVPERSQVWFFSDNIYLFNVLDETWSEFNYPEGWETNSSVANTFQNLSYNSMIIISYIEAISNFQALILNIVTGEAKLITAEKGFFDHKTKIEGWNSHPEKYIIMKNKEIYSYDSLTNTIELLMKDFGFGVFSIMQDESGRYLYVLGDTSLNVLDLIDKTVETHEIPLDEGYLFSGSGIYDSARKKIIVELGMTNFSDRIFGIINLEDFLISYIENLSDSFDNNSFFLGDKNLLVLLSDLNSLRIVDLASFEIKNFIPIRYIATSWNVIDDLNKPILLNNQSGSDFIRILPDNCRENNNAGLGAEFVCQFPDGNNALIANEVEEYISANTSKLIYTCKIYDFEEKSARKIQIPFSCHEFITDTKNNQVIGLTFIRTLYNLVEFIRPDNFITTWLAPEELKFITHIFDVQNSILWVLLKNNDNGSLYFYKLSTKEKTLLDSFTLDKGTFAIIKSIVCDPNDKFLYFIDETNNATQRDLAILDINTREIIKKITLQTEVENGFVTTIVIPGIIPIPEKDKLFIWDHYVAWSIDTNSWEVLYGEAQNNPTALGFRSINEPDMNGKFIKDKNLVLVVDRNNEVLEVDLDT
ncbi:hypothetical protein KKB18_01120, partial [bacterium]|nr:hypothetical protein [bacterium]